MTSTVPIPVLERVDATTGLAPDPVGTTGIERKQMFPNSRRPAVAWPVEYRASVRRRRKTTAMMK